MVTEDSSVVGDVNDSEVAMPVDFVSLNSSVVS